MTLGNRCVTFHFYKIIGAKASHFLLEPFKWLDSWLGSSSTSVCSACQAKGAMGIPLGIPSEEGREPAWLCWACKVSLQSFRSADPVFVLQSLCFLCLPCGQLMCSSRLVAAMTGNLTLQSNDPEIYCSWMTDISSLLGTGMSSPRFLYPFPA